MKHVDANTNTDALLHEGFVQAPHGFRDSVMREIATYERSRELAPDGCNAQTQDVLFAVDEIQSGIPWWQWLALTVGSVIGIGQVFRFIFSVWFVSSAAY